MNTLISGLLVAFLLAIGGCGPGSAPTSHLAGAVTIGGKPVPSDADAAISFSLVDGAPQDVAKAKIVDGKYDCPDVPRGQVQVSFSISQPYGPEKVSSRTGTSYRETRNLVPAKYLAGMTLQVSGDNTSQDFDLEIQRRRR